MRYRPRPARPSPMNRLCPPAERKRRRDAVIDWLGAQKPLNLILYAVIAITLIALAARLG